MDRIRLTLTGIVQGVGFRPHVATLAAAFPVTGQVSNTDTSLLCEVQGDAVDVEAFTAHLLTHLPPLATVLTTTTEQLPIIAGEEGFRVVDSQHVPGTRTLIPPDIATCEDCLREFHDPTDRRYHYPFINCTNCGPRLTIIEDLPYDRPLTTMRDFPMCEACASEYADPANRRFHAEPTACPTCGPQLWAGDFSDQPLSHPDEVAAACLRWIDAGKTVAVKGLGGYHLLCDATNPQAVGTLRARKRRLDKPFAVLVPPVVIATVAGATAAADPVSPIVLTPTDAVNRALSAHGFAPIAAGVAPRLDRVGIMAPYTPLHHLLLEATARPLVATSGNRSGEPLIYDDAEALDPRRGLAHLADHIIGHTRRIHLPVEDSVVLAAPAPDPTAPAYLPIRRSRGFAPVPVPLSTPAPAAAPDRTILAVGGEMKNTFTLVEGHLAHMSAHVGEMGSWASQQAWEKALDQLLALRRTTPDLVVCDIHPNYATTALAERLARRWDVPLIEVQHHHAHALSLAAEHQITAGPLPVATLDGTGYGLDGTIWGGEILVLGANLTEFVRAWHLPEFHLTGGDQAVRHPATIAANLRTDWGLADTAPATAPATAPPTATAPAPARPGASVATTSLGRLFDAVAYLLGLVQTEATYEGQAAMELEALARTWATAHLDRAADVVGSAPAAQVAADSVGSAPAIVRRVLAAARDPEVGPGGAAWLFHREIGQLIGSELVRCAREWSSPVVGVSGGSAINQLLVNAVRESIGKLAPDITLLTHRAIPAGDGGLSLGQAYAEYLSAGSSLGPA
ncbi:MAG: carbamoyltransferase HypF [Corynebacterium sp.]|nr:carbamoyltransferase HypF [Corynebacterium sp.]